MPAGLKWSKENRRWVKDTHVRTLYYDGFDPKSWGLLVSYWRYYPDRLLDMLESDNPKYSLELIQRIFIRAFLRYPEVFITASRGTTKSFCADATEHVKGIVYPGVTDRYAGPAKEQLAQIMDGVEKELLAQYKYLSDYWNIVSNSKENFEIISNGNSVISIRTNRGDTCNGCIAEEVAQEEKGKAFDHENFRAAVLPSVRGQRMVQRKLDPFFPQFQKGYITSAGKTTNYAFEYRTPVLNGMLNGDKRKFCIDVPSEVAVLSRIRQVSWREDLKSKLTAEEWQREMDSLWTGTSENPLIRDMVLTGAKNLLNMEDSHCQDPDVFYVIGYDVSYADGANNARCATAVVKCEKQKDRTKQDRYLKSLVYVTDSPPPPSHTHQARTLKMVWQRYSMEESNYACYVAIDSNQYGRGVTEEMHKDLEDGLPRLCCMNHDYPELESKDALPVVYPIHATPGTGGRFDSDSEMIRYAELEFEHGNIRLLTGNVYDGVENYKKAHGIKDDEMDAQIALPYRKTREMTGQIGNLTKKTSGYGVKEERISRNIQRDMWSAFKYALRVVSLLEYQNLVVKDEESSWGEEYARMESGAYAVNTAAYGSGRRGGNGL